MVVLGNFGADLENSRIKILPTSYISMDFIMKQRPKFSKLSNLGHFLSSQIDKLSVCGQIFVLTNRQKDEHRYLSGQTDKRTDIDCQDKQTRGRTFLSVCPDMYVRKNNPLPIIKF